MINVITSNILNYQSFFEREFRSYLKSTKTSTKTITNYLSDIRTFILWLVNSIQSSNTPLPEKTEQLVSLVTPDIIDNFIQSHILQHTPISSINRKLSALRLFFRFCESKNWINDNPCEHVSNIPKIKSLFGIPQDKLSLLLVDYAGELSFNHLTNEQKIQSISDIRNFLYWLEEYQNIS